MVDMANINITETNVCWICHGKCHIRLNHAASASCWKCTNGQIINDLEECWISFARCVMDKDPFQNGAHSTWPLFYVKNELERWERANEDIAFELLQRRNEAQLRA